MMQVPYKKQVKKALKRQDKGTKVHQAHEIALILGNNTSGPISSSPSPQIDTSDYVANGGVAAGYGFPSGGHQSVSMPHLQQVVGNQQLVQRSFAAGGKHHQGSTGIISYNPPLTIVSPMGHVMHQSQTPHQLVIPATAMSQGAPGTAGGGKMFQRGGNNTTSNAAVINQKNQAYHQSATQSTKAGNAVPVKSLIQQQMRIKQQQQHHGNYPSQIIEAPQTNQKIFYPHASYGGGAGPLQPQKPSKSSRSRTQLSTNMQGVHAGSSSAEALIFQSAAAQPSPHMLGSLNANQQVAQQQQMLLQMSGQQQHTSNQLSNIMMRQQCASATGLRPKRGTTSTSGHENTSQQVYQQHTSNNAHAQQQLYPQSHYAHKSKKKQVSNLINASVIQQQRGSTKHISRPMTSVANMAPMSVTPHGGAYPIPINLNATISGDSHAYSAQQLDYQQKQNTAVIRSSRSNNTRGGGAKYNQLNHHLPQKQFESPSISKQKQQLIRNVKQQQQRSRSGKKNKNKQQSSATPQQQNQSALNKQLQASQTKQLMTRNNNMAVAAKGTSLQFDQTSQKSSSRRRGADDSSSKKFVPSSSILTVTVLESKLKVDMSGFLHKMQVYCQVSLQTLGVAPECPVPETSQSKRSKSSPQGAASKPASAVILESVVKKTQSMPGMEPKWSECFVFDLKGASRYVLELSVWSSNYLVSDSCIGRAYLMFDGSHSETGSITNWLTLKSENGEVENGEIFVSISKEAILKANKKQTQPAAQNEKQHQKPQWLYKHSQMQSTEGCAAMEGDQDDHHAQLMQAHQQAFLAQQQQNSRLPDESEVNSAEDDTGTNIYAIPKDSEVDEDEEGLDSPVDDIILEEQQQLQMFQQMKLDRLQNKVKMGQQPQFDNYVLNQPYHHYPQSQLQQQQAQQIHNNNNNNYCETTQTEGELDSQLQAVSRATNVNQNMGVPNAIGQQQQMLYQQMMLQQPEIANAPSNMVAEMAAHQQLFQTTSGAFPHMEHQTPQNQQHFANYHTGGFRTVAHHKNQQHPQTDADGSEMNEMSDHGASWNQSDFQQMQQQAPQNNYPYMNQPQQLLPNYNNVGVGGMEDSDSQDLEEQSGDQSLGDDPSNEDADKEDGNDEGGEDGDGDAYSDDESADDEDNADNETDQQESQHISYGIAQQRNDYSDHDQNSEMNVHLIQQMQQQNQNAVVEELADLQNDIVEENARLRQEVISIDKIQKKIQNQNKQIKHEKSNLKQMQAKLNNKTKRIGAQQEQLVQRKQQMEKESIKVNKSFQKLRRMRQTLEQASQMCSGLVKSEIFSKLRYEASLTQHSPEAAGSQHDTSDDWLLAMQAHEFVTSFEKVKIMLEQVVSDQALQGGATGSGDLNSKNAAAQYKLSNNTGVVGDQSAMLSANPQPQTAISTQHNQHHSQSSSTQANQNQGLISTIMASKQRGGGDNSTSAMTSGNNLAGRTNHQQQPQQFMSEDTSICGDRNMLAGIMADSNASPAYGGRLQNGQIVQQQNEKMGQVAGVPQGSKNEAYWTHSSIREIRAQTSNAQQPPQSMGNAWLVNNNTNDRSAPTQKTGAHVDMNEDSSNYMNAKLMNRSGVQPVQSSMVSPTKSPHKPNEVQSNTSGLILQQRQQLNDNSQIRMHTEVGNESKEGLMILDTNSQQMQAAREIYEQHLDVDLELVSNTQLRNEAPPARQNNFQHQVMTGSSMTPEPAAHMNPLMAQQQDQYDAMYAQNENGGKLFLTKQVTAVNGNSNNQASHQYSQATPGAHSNLIIQQQLPIITSQNTEAVQHQQQQPNQTNLDDLSRTSSQAFTGVGAVARHQEIYNELIGQMSKELTDIKAIKQDLLSQMQSSKQYQHDNSSSRPENQSVGTSEEQIIGSNGQTSSQYQGLQNEQMRFLHDMQNQEPDQKFNEVQQVMIENNMEDGDNQDDSDNDDKDIVEGYIWESMQRNAQRMQQLKTEKGIVDPVELERELLRNFKTNEIMPINSDQEHLAADNIMMVQEDHENVSGILNCNQDEQKFTSSYIIESAQVAAGASGQSLEQQPPQANLQQEEQDDEMEFKFDPDFLNKINANMAMNDQIFEQRYDQQISSGGNVSNVAEMQQYSQQQQHHAGVVESNQESLQAQNLQQQQQQPDHVLMQQSTLQGEQLIQDNRDDDRNASSRLTQQENDEDANSFISREDLMAMPVNQSSSMHPDDRNQEEGNEAGAQQVAVDGPSFIMDYSNNQDLRNSQITGMHDEQPSQIITGVVSARVSQTGSQLFLQGGGADGTNSPTTPLPMQETQFNNNGNTGTGSSGGAAPATLLLAAIIGKQNTSAGQQQLASGGNMIQHQVNSSNTLDASSPPHIGFKSPRAVTAMNLMSGGGTGNQLASSREKGSVVLPAVGGDEHPQSMTNTVEKQQVILTTDTEEDHQSQQLQQQDQSTEEPKIEHLDIAAKQQQQQMTANDFEISNRSSVRSGLNEQEAYDDDISRMINESYLEQNDTRNLSVIYKDEKIYDQPKRALYGIQPVKESKDAADF